MRLPSAPASSAIAIIGMAALFPQARSLQEYWRNIVEKRDCITDVPSTHWNVDDCYDPDPAPPTRPTASAAASSPRSISTRWSLVCRRTSSRSPTTHSCWGCWSRGSCSTRLATARAETLIATASPWCLA